MIDTLRADHTSAYGYPRDTTPHLKKLLGEGVHFTRAYAPTSTTGPSTVSMFTSLYPIAHNLLRNGVEVSDGFHTIAEMFQDSGYQTFGVSSSVPISAPGLGQGFDEYDDKWPRNHSSPRIEKEGDSQESAKPAGKNNDGYFGYDRRPNFTTDSVIDWFSTGREEERPYFAFVHYMDPHEPYTPLEEHLQHFPEPEESSDLYTYNLAVYKREYDAEIRFTDAEIGRLLEHLEGRGELDNTLIVVVADHGQGMYDHGWPGHGRDLYEELVRIPFIMAHRGRIPEGLAFNPPVGLLDVLPTLLDYASIPFDENGFHGRSLRPLIEGGDLEETRPMYLQRQFAGERNKVLNTYTPGPLFALRKGDWKYIEGTESGLRELYNLRDDPKEATNLAAARPEVVAELSGNLAAWRQQHVAGGSGDEPEVLDELREGLEALGYVD